MKKDTINQPISNMQWLHRDDLKANAYNPNKVAPIELELLVESILTCGWTQPIVVRSNYEIVDGYHRWVVSSDPRLLEKTEGKVPVVILDDDLSKAEQISATITHNRARGSHYVMKMSELVQSLKTEHKVNDEWLQKKLGMEQEEIDRLNNANGSPDTKGDGEFELGWVPDFTRAEGG
tara:strand:- start:13521 stop:14054 length:534 start_codon:yes stop_codon:yes gene_type:complete